MEPKIDITQKNRQEISKILNGLLADEYVLSVKTKNYHWNLYGVHFRDLHLLFDEQYGLLTIIIDEVAERARSLGYRALGTLTEFLERTLLKEVPGSTPPASDMIRSLLEDHEIIIKSLRTAIPKSLDNYGDVGTNNFLTDILERHEKMAWMLRSFLQKEADPQDNLSVNRG
jgi:starvation-inducible DNA-binding protein